MIVSRTTKRSASRWTHICFLLLAVAILPVGLAFAGEHEGPEKKKAGEKREAIEKKEAAKKKQSIDEYYKKTWAKLQAKVETGEMTQEEARKKMAAIKKAKSGKKPITQKDYAQAEKKIKKAVDAGEMTPEEGRKKLQWMRKEMGKMVPGEQGRDGRAPVQRKITQADYNRTEAQLFKAVENGRISAEDARKRLAGMRHMMAKQDKRDHDGKDRAR